MVFRVRVFRWYHPQTRVQPPATVLSSLRLDKTSVCTNRVWSLEEVIALLDQKAYRFEMRCLKGLWIIPAFCTFLDAETIGQPIPDLKAPLPADAARVKQVENIGTLWWLKNRGLLAEESPRVVGYFSVFRPIKGFADRGDIVWEVRILYIGSQPTGILWVNEKNQKVIGLGLDQK